MRRKIIVFDFDGVIVNSFPFCYEINSRIYPKLTEEEYKEFFKKSLFDLIESSLKRDDLNKNIDFDIEYSTSILEIEPVPQIKELLLELKKDNTLIINSSNKTQIIEKYLNKYSLSSIFDQVLGGDIEKSKTVKLKNIINSYNLEEKDCVFVTDTLGDIIEASIAGINTIGVTWGFHNFEILNEGKPTRIIDKVEELTPAINNILNKYVQTK